MPLNTTVRVPFRTSAWGMRRNTLPITATGADGQPFDDGAVDEEIAEFIDRVIIGGLTPRAQLAYLYSSNEQGGEDTGFGKTRMMLRLRSVINEDLGASLLDGLVDDDERILFGAAYATFDDNLRTGYYPVLVRAVYDAATAGETPLLQQAYERISGRVGSEPWAIERALRHSQTKLGVALRQQTVDAFCNDGAPGVAADTTAGSTVHTHVRSGIQWLYFLLAALHAAEIERLYLFVDQLEDLALNKSMPRARRYREIGRIRDLTNDEPTRSMLHTTFTMHDNAAPDLKEFWVPHRLLSYDLNRANTGHIVLLKGLRSDNAAAAVLSSWLAEGRIDDYTGDPLVPFEMSAVRALREISERRVGEMLPAASKVFDAAERERVEVIDGAYVDEILSGAGIGGNLSDGDEDSAPLLADDDLLA
jgi:hypothetical protein